MQRPVLLIQELFPEMELGGTGFEGGGLSVAWQLVCDPWGNLGVRSFCIDDQQWDILQGGQLPCSVLCLKLCCVNTLSNFIQQCIVTSACVLAGKMTQIYHANPWIQVQSDECYTRSKCSEARRLRHGSVLWMRIFREGFLTTAMLESRWGICGTISLISPWEIRKGEHVSTCPMEIYEQSYFMGSVKTASLKGCIKSLWPTVISALMYKQSLWVRMTLKTSFWWHAGVTERGKNAVKRPKFWLWSEGGVVSLDTYTQFR